MLVAEAEEGQRGIHHLGTVLWNCSAVCVWVLTLTSPNQLMRIKKNEEKEKHLHGGNQFNVVIKWQVISNYWMGFFLVLHIATHWLKFQFYVEKLLTTVAKCTLPLHWFKGHKALGYSAAFTLWTSRWFCGLFSCTTGPDSVKQSSSRDTVTLEVESPTFPPNSSQPQRLSRLL